MMNISLEKSSQEKVLQEIYESIWSISGTNININPIDKISIDSRSTVVSGEHYEIFFEDKAIERYFYYEFGRDFIHKSKCIQQELLKYSVIEKINKILDSNIKRKSRLNFFRVNGSESLIIGVSEEILSNSFQKNYSSSVGKNISKEKIISICKDMKVSLNITLPSVEVSAKDLMSLKVGEKISSNRKIKEGLRLKYDDYELPSKALLLVDNNKNKIIFG
ncbi:hypothetical protein MHN79_06540 [Vibrio sp. Of14-4]|uniref:hypothetical protein n=1 Tax=Vibrio sp. Of14-4 TaxID=2724878 RepID=UPI001EF3258E|nr:hypothetical protein [Vibrio sp. Of14-4]MCG7489141.1 hypothetical protein [Vibrio sp. Of14-4]